MDISDYVNSLNQETGLNLALDGSQAVNFTYEGRNVLLHFEEKLGVCVVLCEVAVLENAALPAALSALLEANFLLSDTKGGSLSWSAETRMVSMNFLLPLKGTAAGEFINMLNRALSAADEWRENIGKINRSALDRVRKYQNDLRKKGASSQNSQNSQGANTAGSENDHWSVPGQMLMI